MTARRSVLCVPASEPEKVVKALASDADEVVIDLEDAVAITQKDEARANLAAIRGRQQGTIAVRVNAVGSAWLGADLTAVIANPAIQSVVVPKAERAIDIADIGEKVSGGSADRPPIALQLIIESARGLVAVHELAAASNRLVALVIGYADLAADLGRRAEASWQYTRDAVLIAARAVGLQAIDGPLLSVQADDHLARAAAETDSLGFDGKWVIHPRQVAIVQAAFTPTAEAVEEAVAILEALDAAARAGRGAVEWRGRMLDEAVAAQARRILARTAQR